MFDCKSEIVNHILNMQIMGIHVPDLHPFTDNFGYKNHRFLRLHFKDNDNNIEMVPLKFPAVEIEKTPYKLRHNKLYFINNRLNLTNGSIQRIPIQPEESEWHYKGYTFPFEGTSTPYKELRINLKISGHCPGHCRFCHRWHSHIDLKNKTFKRSMASLLKDIIKNEGD